MTLVPLSSDPEPLAFGPATAWLDEEHVLEPLDVSDPDHGSASAPIVVDATGRMWRLRYRPVWTSTLTRAAPWLLGVVLMVLLLVFRV